MGRVAEEESELLHPEDFVHETRKTGGEEQDESGSDVEARELNGRCHSGQALHLGVLFPHGTSTFELHIRFLR